MEKSGKEWEVNKKEEEASNCKKITEWQKGKQVSLKTCRKGSTCWKKKGRKQEKCKGMKSMPGNSKENKQKQRKQRHSKYTFSQG